jgi:flagellar basal-body rod modification protein FlgD
MDTVGGATGKRVGVAGAERRNTPLAVGDSMNVADVAAGSGATAANAAARDRGLGSLKSEDFFKILITELRQQDPMEPQKSADIVNQVSQLRSIELSSQLSNTLDGLARTQRTAGTGDMLGKYVAAQVAGPDGAPVTVDGLVTGVHFNPDGAAMLELDNGQALAASDVMLVTTPEAWQARLDAVAAAQDGGAAAKLTKAPAKPASPWDQLRALFGLAPA